VNMLNKQMNGKINSWAIRWCYHQFKHKLYSVYPLLSKVENIGFDKSATHTQLKYNRFRAIIDTEGKETFLFDPECQLIPDISKQFIAKFSIRSRIYSRFRNLIPDFK
jgi:hypothetical protein